MISFAPAFVQMIKYAWIASIILVERRKPFWNANERKK